MSLEHFKKSEAWQAARLLGCLVFQATSSPEFDHDSRRRDKLRCAALFVVMEIAEGSESGSSSEFLRRLERVKSGLRYLESLCHDAHALFFMDCSSYELILEKIMEVDRLTQGLVQRLIASDAGKLSETASERGPSILT